MHSASVWGDVELHIEQGPVLEALGLPLGVVDAIAGQTRLSVKVRGSQGHAGTVPMSMRKDPMIAAAQSIVAIENICTHPEKGIGGSRGATAMSTAVNHAGAIVCTVGEIHSWPGASNVIPGEVMFTIDIRSKDDTDREKNVVRIESEIFKICKRRDVSCSVERKRRGEIPAKRSDHGNEIQQTASTVIRPTEARSQERQILEGARTRRQTSLEPSATTKWNRVSFRQAVACDEARSRYRIAAKPTRSRPPSLPLSSSIGLSPLGSSVNFSLPIYGCISGQLLLIAVSTCATRSANWCFEVESVWG